MSASKGRGAGKGRAKGAGAGGVTSGDEGQPRRVSARAREEAAKSTPGDTDPARITRVRFLETQIRALLGAAELAHDTNQPGAEVAAIGKAADLRVELDKLRAFEREKRAKRTPLEQVRAMRARADAAGSHVAAQGYLKLELDLVAKEEAERQEAERQRLIGMALDERVQRLVELLVSLPAEVREQVKTAVWAEVH